MGHALTPIVQFQDLVAGEGEPGFEDGPFYSAQFNMPLGMALNHDASLLYVADQQNNRVRVIHFNEKNAVTTLAGTGIAGHKDGPITLATFDQPSGLALLPDDQIAVNDLGNNLIRIIDLKTNSVSTLAGGASSGLKDGEALKTQLGGLWNLVYFPSDQCLYFSEPDAGVLRKLDMKTREVKTVLKNYPLVPNPAALCVVNGNLYVADRAATLVYEIQSLDKKKGSPPTPTVVQTSTPIPAQDPPLSVSLVPVGPASGVIALAGSQSSLYAYQSDLKAPLVRVFPDAAPITFTSVWGYRLINPDPGSILPNFRNTSAAFRIGFVADPHSEGRFYLSNPNHFMVTAFRDLRLPLLGFTRGEDVFNSGEIHDLEYPHAKPQGTYRILLVGRSYLYWESEDRQFEEKGQGDEFQNLTITLAKRMELELNTMAALEDAPLHYEVLNSGRHRGSNELNVWPYHVVPPIAEKYDIDLVLILHDEELGIESFMNAPMTSEGVPALLVDPEFRLKPNSEKFKAGTFHDLYELCLSKKLMDKTKQCNLDAMAADPEVRPRLFAVMGKPLKMLQTKLGSMKTGTGSKRRLELCYFPIFESPAKTKRVFWRDLCQSIGVPFMDVCDDFKTLGLTYSPYSTSGARHFTVNGMTLFSRILVHELLSNKKIPFK